MRARPAIIDSRARTRHFYYYLCVYLHFAKSSLVPSLLAHSLIFLQEKRITAVFGCREGQRPTLEGSHDCVRPSRDYAAFRYCLSLFIHACVCSNGLPLLGTATRRDRIFPRFQAIRLCDNLIYMYARSRQTHTAAFSTAMWGSLRGLRFRNLQFYSCRTRCSLNIVARASTVNRMFHRQRRYVLSLAHVLFVIKDVYR